MKTIKYRGKTFEIKLILNDPKDQKPAWQLVIDNYVIEIKTFNKKVSLIPYVTLMYSPPVEIIQESEWNSCLFREDSLILHKAEDKDKKDLEGLEYIGLFKPAVQDTISNDTERYYVMELIDTGYSSTFLSRWNGLIPIPIQCTVRDMTPEERLLLSQEEKLTDQEREQKHKAAEQERLKLLQENAALREKAGMNLKEALAEFMKHEFPGMSTDTRARIKEAVSMYMQPGFRSLSKVAEKFNVSKKTVSTWLNTFTDKTGWPVIIYKKHKSVKSQADIESHTGAKHIPKRIHSADKSEH